MEKYLSTKERAALLQRHRKERDKRICDRIKAVLAYDDGYSYSEIARILLLDETSIRNHIKDYFSTKKLRPENGGSKSKLCAHESEQLISHLKQTTYLYVKDICAYVRTFFGKQYSTSGMTKWLRSQGFRYKKPQPVPAKADKVRQEAFVEEYKALKARAVDEPIYFVDSVHPHHQTRLAYGWIIKGVRKLLPQTGRQYRLNIMGGICLNGHKLIYEEAEKINTDSIKHFLSRLRKKHKDNKNIHVIWDNAGYHKSKEVIAFAKTLSIELHYLPPYSPNLNPIERLWKIMHERVSANQYYEKFSEFTLAIRKFLKSIGRRKKILRARITDNLQILSSPLMES